MRYQPMLATLVDRPFDDDDWVFEIKWDGFRSIAYLNKGQVELRSRNDKDFNTKFYPVYDALKKWKINAVVDGEIVVLNEKGMADFEALQNWRSEADGPLVFYLFDLLEHNGKSLTGKSLLERKKILKKIIPSNHPVIRLNEHFETGGSNLFKMADELGLEGIIAKKSDSVYTSGIRSSEWLKIKTEKRQEAIIGGFTRNEGSSKIFSSLLLGISEGSRFHYIGSVGTGFNKRMQEVLLSRMLKLVSKKAPFDVVPDVNKPSRFRPDPPHAEVTWVKPEIVVEISYREMTKDGILRHPSFKGIRDDKEKQEVIPEVPKKTKTIISEKKENLLGKSLKSVKKERSTLLNPQDETQVRTINGHDIKFTNLSKIFWPEEKYTKRDLLNYYYQVAPFIVPYITDRPQTLYRHPHGINGEAFYQKDVTGKAPSWVKTFPYFSEADDREKHFLVGTDESSLMYIASLGCIEINPWSSTIQKPDHPDWCIIDLDPDKNTFNQVIEAARVTHEVLETAGVKSFCKTSGSTGLHIYIPLGKKYTYEDSKELGRVIACIVHSKLPSFTSIERKTADRKGKMYIDFLQNRPQATVAGPYSVRPKPGATVSTPLLWEEVKKGLTMKMFTMKTVPARLKETGDLFTGVLGKGIDLQKAKKTLLDMENSKDIKKKSK